MVLPLFRVYFFQVASALAKLFPVYQQLSKDDIWGVRKACAESICEAQAPASAMILCLFDRDYLRSHIFSQPLRTFL